MASARTSLLADGLGLIRKFLNLLLRQDPQHDDTVLALLETLLGAFESFRVDEFAVNAGPAGAGGDLSALKGVFVRSNAFADRLGIFRELLRGLA